MLAKRLVEEDIVTCRCREHHPHTNPVSTEFLDQFDRIGRVTQRLGHLTTQLIANDTGEVDTSERHVANILIASHNHAGYPEEDDIRTCHEDRCGIVILDLFVAGIVDSVEEADGPEP